MVRFTIIEGPDSGAAYELGEGTFSIGRSPDNSLVLAHSSVSRCHALVICQPGCLRLEDLGSVNGTFHNGFRVVACPLEPGDRIGIGEYEFLCERRVSRRFGFLAGVLRGAGLRRRRAVRRPAPIPVGMLAAIAQAGDPLMDDAIPRPRR